MRMNDNQFALIQNNLKNLMSANGFYSEKLRGLCPEDIRDQADFERLPFTDKNDLREAYPLGLQDPHHAGLRAVDGGHRFSGGRGADRRDGHPHGARQH